VRDAATHLVARGTLDAHPTFFEVLTAAAFEHFRVQEIDVAVLEVGLGGRLDATNIVEPLASAIVSIAFDHEVYLGRTLGAIAAEKAGVMRRGTPTVIGPVPAEARRALAAAAKEKGARLVDATRGGRLRETLDGLELRTRRCLYRGLRPLPGEHQRTNLLVAIRLLEAAFGCGVPVDLLGVPDAIARTRWPGRLEKVAGDPPLVLDGAHNPAGARALAAHLRGGPPFVLVFAAMADKDVEGIARALFPLATAVVLTQPRVSRAASPGELARRCGPLAREAHHEPSVSRALAHARRLARRRPGTVVVVAGSLYLVGAVEAILERERERARYSR
jgi:dihydrofolate synthase/folylpolyglutamate synthase